MRAKQAKLNTVRETLDYFVRRADGCPNKDCSVCAQHKRLANEAFGILDELIKKEQGK